MAASAAFTGSCCRLSGGDDPGGSGCRVRVREAGDSGLLLELEAVVDPAVNARADRDSRRRLRRSRVAGVRDVLPTYRSVAVHFDPMVTDVDSLRASLHRAAARAPVARLRARWLASR
jgi:allophanate hydrolase subunit 1